MRWPFLRIRKIHMKQRSVIFDLDGTLIDSAPSILASIEAAFYEEGIEPTVPLSIELIGPPLERVLVALLGLEKIDRLPQLIKNFKKHYDNVGYRETQVYAGVQPMLEQLNRDSLKLYIATNKRLIPTRLITEHLGWGSFFEKLFTLDSYHPPAQDKSEMLKRLILDLREPNDCMIYVGDRLEDAEAARVNNIPFVLVSWGYEKSIPTIFLDTVVNSPKELVDEVLPGGGLVPKHRID